jgi:hypothetical protein
MKIDELNWLLSSLHFDFNLFIRLAIDVQTDAQINAAWDQEKWVLFLR